MPLQTHPRMGRSRQRRNGLSRLFLALTLLLLVLGLQASVLTSPPALAQEPTREPAQQPTAEPTQTPTAEPTQPPTAEPTQQPTAEPTQPPTAEPTQQPAPTAEPTQPPTAEPTQVPTAEPTEEPPPLPAEPTPPPTAEPTEEPPPLPAQPLPPPTVEPSEELTATAELTFGVAEPWLLPLPYYTVNLEVRVADPLNPAAVTGTLISNFTYIVNEDNTGNPADPDPEMHPGLKPMASHSPIVAAGGPVTGTVSFGLPDLPDPNLDGFDLDRFLISVRAPGYKLWGRHVSFLQSGPTPDPIVKTVVVTLMEEPLPLARLVVTAFHDRQPVNSAPDGVETDVPLNGFHVVIEDAVGEVTVDWFANPLCTQYAKDSFGNIIDVAPADGVPDTILPGPPLNPQGHYCTTGALGVGAGTVIIENIPYGQYDTFVIPPDGSGWIQTSTFEGTKAIEHSRLMEGDDGFGAVYEALREPLVTPTAFWFGFIKECQFGNTGDTCGAANDTVGGATVIGQARTFVGWPPFEQLLLGEGVYKPWIALSDVGNSDQQVFTGRGNADGTFTIPNVPPSTYQMAIFDDALDWIISYRTVVVTSATTIDMGDIAVPRWFGWVSGHVFRDADEDGIMDLGEGGIKNQDLDIRWRDGSVKSATFTDDNGYYEFAEEFSPLFKFYIAEVGFGRFARTGHSVHDDHFANHPLLFTDVITTVPTDLGGGLLLNQLVQPSKRTIIDWGKLEYPADDPATPNVYEGSNGGIAGIVFYGTTRNEFEARLQANEDYEPGIPGVTMRLWGLGTDGLPNTNDDEFLNELQTDTWSHPRFDHPDLPQTCDALDKDGIPLAIIPDGADVKCLEYPLLSNETKAGAFDGGFQFESACATGLTAGGDADSDGTPNHQDPTPLLDPSVTCTTVLTPTDYIVQVVPPPFYQLVKEEDVNVDEGSALVPAFPPPPCVGPTHVVTDTRSPFDGQSMPLCNKRLVTLQDQQNAEANYFLFTDVDADPNTNTADAGSWTTTESVPIPGRIFGLVSDDFNFDTNPNSLWYGEERPIQDTPIGLRDFTGRQFTAPSINSDENGHYEVLLPSTFQMNCPIPSGVCPGMYVVRINDPGDLTPTIPPDAPNYNPANPNYKRTHLTEPAPFEVWPGKATFADTPLDPIGWWSCAPINNPGGPEFAGLKAEVEFFSLSEASVPYGSPGASFGIQGLNFGETQVATSSVTLGGVPLTPTFWSSRTITVTIPSTFTLTGPQQLLVTNDVGSDSLTGLTFHVIGGGYSPTIVNVFPVPNPPSGPLPTPIQDAIDTASAGALIVVHPGTYEESPILHQGVKLQGYGPGGIAGMNNPLAPILAIEDPRIHVKGSVIEGRFFESYRTAWEAHSAVSAGVLAGTIPSGAAVTVVGDSSFGAAFNAQLDGFWITGANGEGGGGVHVDADAPYLQISNNVVENNGGTRGGGISLGERFVSDNNNDNIRIFYNRIVNNGAISIGAGIALFNGADNYQINNNDICGNYGGEYGGGIGHFGLSLDGRIDHNRIRLNDAYDEGGGLIVAGEQPTQANPAGVGSGVVTITHNLIGGNFSNDDGGGIRLLRPLTYRIKVENNMIAHNLATDHGGGISLDDASNVVIVNNTLVNNVTTATAVDRQIDTLTGRSLPRGAGLTSELNSGPFQAMLPSGAPIFSNPVLFNNIFWENLAFVFDPNVTPVPEPPGDPGTARLPLVLERVWDLEVIDFDDTNDNCFDPRFSVLSNAYGPDATACTTPDPSNIIGDLTVDATGVVAGNVDLPQFFRPVVIDEFNAAPTADPNVITVEYWRAEGVELFLSCADYHLLPPGAPAPPVCGVAAATPTGAGSPAIDRGIGVDPIGGVVTAPCDDFDDDGRPFNTFWDIGADEQPGLPVPTTCSGGTPAGSMVVAKVVTPNPVLAGGTLTYTVIVTNTGSVNLTATLTDTLPSQVNPNDPQVFGPVVIPTGGVFTQDIVVTVNANYSGTLTNTVQVTTLEGPISAATITSTAIVPPSAPVPAATLYLSLANNGGATGYTVGLGPGPVVTGVRDEDIIGWDGGTGFIMIFDGSDVGLGGTDVDAFYIDSANGKIYLSLETPTTLGSLGLVADSDILQFTATSLGTTTAGSFSLFFDGSEVGLNGNGEDVDAIELLPDGRLLVSTIGPPSVPGLNSGLRDEDLLAFTPDTPGNYSGDGTWSLYFNGSNSGIAGSNAQLAAADEDVDAASVAADGNIYLSTTGTFSVPGVAGANEDVFVCGGSPPATAPTTGPLTACAYSPTLFFNGSAFGLAGNDVDAIELP